jgi:hypothetical protein
MNAMNAPEVDGLDWPAYNAHLSYSLGFSSYGYKRNPAGC